MKKFFERILSPYKDASFIIKKKSKILLVFDIIMLSVSIPFLFLQFVNFDINTVLTILTSAMIYGTSIILIAKGKYSIASTITVFFLALALTVPAFTSGDHGNGTSIYLHIYLTLFMFILSVFISNTIVQPIMVMIIGILSQTALFFTFVMPAIPSENLTVMVSTYVSHIIIMGISGIICILIVKNQNKSLRIAMDETEKNKHKLLQLEEIVKVASSGMQIGQNLMDSSQLTVSAVQKIEGMLIEMKGSVETSNNRIFENDKTTDGMIEYVNIVREAMDTQNTMISQASAATEQMNASIETITRISESKKDAILNLVETVKKSSDDMEEAINAIGKIEESSKMLIEINQLIKGVAQKTNLLSMNAAIEAAHAGEHGAGFSVVANEIRKLAVITAGNSKEISDTLKKNADEITETVKLNQEAGKSFEVVNQKIIEVSGALDEIINNMSELSISSSEILQSTAQLLSTSGKTNDSVNNIVDIINTNKTEVSSILEDSRENAETIQNIINEFNAIITEAQGISLIGKKNIDHIKELEEKLDQVL